ncbi:MAG TPA: transketolase C-terminal domain-containing protein [Kiritimatiellia bacterium]|nr:transketolase C-terminal domain-containing protein [Kiritimatiellia bacterium]
MTDRPAKRMRDMFLQGVLEEMNAATDIFFVTADFGSPVLDNIREQHPDRFLNVGIAEQNLINISTGLALEGFRVFAYAIAPFITMRCLEQTRTNLCVLASVKPLSVCLVGVGAGMSYDVSGPTHQALEDISIMRSLPNMAVFSPADAECSHDLAKHVSRRKGASYVRLDGKALPPIYQANERLDWNKGFNVLRKGTSASLVSTGYMTHKAMETADILTKKNKRISVVDVYSLNHLNAVAFADCIKDAGPVITLEEGFTGRGGLDCLIMNAIKGRTITALGLLPEYRFDIGNRDDLLKLHGLDANTIAEKVLQTAVH